MDRSRSSADRFGYPSNMDSWAHHGAPAEPEYVSYQYSTGVGRMAQQGWREEADRDLGRSASFGSYGEGSLDREYDSSIGLKGRSFFGKGPKGYKRSDDRIKEDVCETLARNPRVDASDIEVSVEAACVTLTGTVESKEIKRAAEMAIENLSGVDDVKNELRVKRADETTFASSSGGKSATSSISTKSRN